MLFFAEMGWGGGGMGARKGEKPCAETGTVTLP